MRESNEAGWSRGMGQESSRPAAPDASSPSTQKTTVTRATLPARQDTRSYITTATQQSNCTPSSSIPSKRSLDERDPDNDAFRTPLRDKFVRTSPEKLGQPSNPDGRGNKTPPGRSGSDLESLSPDSRRRYDRGDYWSPQDRRSSPPRKTSPSRRGSLTRHGSSEYIEWPRPLPKSSPVKPSHPGGERTNSDSRPAPSYSNLTWKAPDLDTRTLGNPTKIKPQSMSARTSSIIPDASVGSRTNDTTKDKVDFNGLKGVPTGPKQAPTSTKGDRLKLPSQPLLPVSAEVKSMPHIFISAEHVPPSQKTRPHLHKFLRSFIPREQDICVDTNGWYLSFEDSDAGRRSLATCVKKHHHAKLFSMYTMHMECFPDGQPESMPAPLTNIDTSLSADNENMVPSADAASNARNFLDDLGLSLETSSPIISGPSIPLEQDLSASHSITNGVITSPLPPQIINHHLRRSSPLSVPSRQERDETSSSISGITGSDISSTKRLNCHVCQKSTSFETDQPVLCSSCPRRYHRRCHPRPAIPANLELDHHWQCRRCVRKQVPPKSRLSNTLPDACFSPAASVGQPDEPSPKRVRIDVSPPDLELGPSISASGLDDSRFHDIDAFTNDRPFALDEELSDADDTYEPAEMPLVNSDEKNLSEANDLVAKSFANIEAVQQPLAKTPVKSGKLNFIRKKLTRTVEVTTTEEPKPKAAMTFQAAAPISTAQSNEPEQIILAQVPENSTPDQHKNAHRWSGGGADEDIIKAGRDQFFTENEPASPHNHASTSGLPNGEAVVDPSAVFEISDSPQELSKSKLEDDGEVGGKGFEHREASFRANVDTTQSASGGSLKIAGGSAASAKQRMKPRTPAISQCVKCRKKIASGPSGTNIYCSRCKKEISKESAARPTGPQAVKSDSKTDRRSKSDLDFRESELAAISALNTHLGEASRSVTRSEQIQPSSVLPKTPDDSCTHCGGVDKKCEHCKRSITSPKPSHVTGKAGAATVEDARAEDDSEADLDFWKAKTPPKPDDSNQNMKDISPDEAPEDKALENKDALDIEAEISPDYEEISHENDLEESAREEAAVSAQLKRRSQTRPAQGSYDLGDSFTRPPNTYVKLIGMALRDAPGYRMKGNDIVQWVIEHIPSYKAKEGKWENSMRATMTLRRTGYQGNEGLWKIVDDGAKKSDGYTYELLLGKAETRLEWDHVLQQPVVPQEEVRIGSNERRGDVTPAANRSHKQPHISESPVDSSRRRPNQGSERADRKRFTSSHRVQMQLDTPDESISAENEMDQLMEDVDDSSSSEPIARRRHKAKQALAGTEDVSGLDANGKDVGHMMDVDVDAFDSAKFAGQAHQPIQSSESQTTAEKPHSLRQSRKPTLEDLIEFEAKTLNYSARYLFDEWPEYDPKNKIDREAKIAEIKARPTRKQKFGKQDPSVEIRAKGPISRYVFSENATLPERPKRSSQATAYPWEAEEENVIQCDTIAELFNLPSNPVAIIHDGEIAYRDGSKNYSRVIYKSGYG